MNRAVLLYAVELATKHVLPVTVDANGRLEIVLNSPNPLPVEMTDPSTIVWENINNTNLAGGSNSLPGTPVPAGEIWIITQFAYQYTGTHTGVVMSVYMNVGGGLQGIVVCNERFIRTQNWYDRQGYWKLFEGDFLSLNISGATAGDDAYLRYMGWRITL